MWGLLRPARAAAELRPRAPPLRVLKRRLQKFEHPGQEPGRIVPPGQRGQVDLREGLDPQGLHEVENATLAHRQVSEGLL
jgi:hypothetical protein